MTEQELVDRYAEVCKLKTQYETERKQLIKQLADLGKDVVQGSHGRYKRRAMRNVVAEQLQSKISTSLWTNITKRVPVADKIKGAIAHGKLSKELVDSCREESDIWFAPTK